MRAIIEPTTAEVAVTVGIVSESSLMVSAGKLAGLETVTFQLAEDGVSSLGNLYQDGELRQLTATHNATAIPGPIDVQITKSATALAVGVYAKN